MIYGLFSASRRLQIGNIFLDGHERESAKFTAVLTDNPTEIGANTVDNAYIDPIQLTVTAFVSETPMFQLNPMGFFNQFKRTSDALAVLYQAQVNRVALDVSCNLGFFTNMFITDVTTRCSNDSVTIVDVDITFKQAMFLVSDQALNPFDDKYRNEVNRGTLQMGSNPV